MISNANNKKIYLKIFIFLLVMSFTLTSMILYKGREVLGFREYKYGNKIVITTSFFPMYVIAANIVEGSNGVEIDNLTPNVTGCLHDFQLSPEQVLKLKRSNALIINGAGAENFLTNVLMRYPTIKLIDSSLGIDLLENSSEHEDHEILLGEKAEVHFNEHIWMDISKYINQVTNITDEICNLDSENAALYQKNRDIYIEKIEQIQLRLDLLKGKIPNKAVLFHNSISYFAKYLDIDIIGKISIGEDEISASLLGEIENSTKMIDTPLLLYDSQFQVLYHHIITNGKVIVLDIGASQSGTDIKNAWLNDMSRNTEKLEQLIL